MIKKRLTISDLEKITWDYSSIERIGLFDNEAVTIFMFEAKECGNINPLAITKCNVAEGWVEYVEFEGEPIKSHRDDIILLPGRLVVDENGNVKRKKLNCNVVIDIISNCGKVIVSLGKKK